MISTLKALKYLSGVQPGKITTKVMPFPARTCRPFPTLQARGDPSLEYGRQQGHPCEQNVREDVQGRLRRVRWSNVANSLFSVPSLLLRLMQRNRTRDRKFSPTLLGE